VGGGVGGLAVASRLAAASTTVRVTLLEKNARVGGRCGSFVTTLRCSWNATSGIVANNWTTITTDRENVQHQSDEESDESSSFAFRHEHGPSLLLLPRVYHELFTDLHTTAAAHGLTMVPCVPAYTAIFDSGDECIHVGFPQASTRTAQSTISNTDAHNDTATTTANSRLAELEAASRWTMDQWEPNGSAKWDQYMTLCQAYLACGLPNFIEERFDWASIPDFLYQAVRHGWPLSSHGDVLAKFFASPQLRALASFSDLYVGLVPYPRLSSSPLQDHKSSSLSIGVRRQENVWGSTAPAVFGLLSALELHPTHGDSGIFAPLGGFGAVQASLEGLARSNNVTIQTNCTVTRITQHGVYYQPTSSRLTATIRTSNVTSPLFLPADVIIVNADLPYATQSLLNENSTDVDSTVTDKFDWDDQYRFSCGVLAFHWCVDRPWTGLTTTHSVFLSASTHQQAVQSWGTVRGDHDLDFGQFLPSADEPFNFYVHRSSHSDPSAAPEVGGNENIMVNGDPCKSVTD
jgi:phytoene desaturase (3,4-didehydrolycopene-forming)